jgi:hypothetical protein
MVFWDQILHAKKSVYALHSIAGITAASNVHIVQAHLLLHWNRRLHLRAVQDSDWYRTRSAEL